MLRSASAPLKGRCGNGGIRRTETGGIGEKYLLLQNEITCAENRERIQGTVIVAKQPQVLACGSHRSVGAEEQAHGLGNVSVYFRGCYDSVGYLKKAGIL